ncbi:PP2C family protein-serine/threonine phosphatase [Kitasatospora indigofera]|uniref:PP2C family protein-serine/threonine phosphatase n=1 Tax=Kitasatospora indigofera TaxID=67307 RepID=UPI003638FAC0
MLAVAAVDLLAGPEVGLLALFALGPAFACITGSVRRALLVGTVAFLLCLGIASFDGLLHTRRAAVALATVLGATAAAALAATVRRRFERELADIRSVAEAAQRTLLRPVPRQAGRMRIAVSYTSAASAARIGGDLYEVVPGPGGTTRVIVGDVQGKGLEAVETAAVVLGAFREAAPDEERLEDVGGRLERALNRRLTGEEFVTAVIAEVDGDHLVTLLNYGHPAPLIVRPDGDVAFADPPVAAPPLGLAALGPIRPSAYEISLTPGDQMLFYTDGVSEARDSGGVFYPLEHRAHLLRRADPDVALEAVRLDLVTHAAGPLGDDAAMLLLRYRDDAPELPD